MKREQIIRKLNTVCNVNSHVIGAVSGSGMMAKYAVMGGADFLLALSAGKFRIMGRGSLASYFCYGDSNEIVMEMGKRELFPILGDFPVMFGLFASDPTIHIYEYLKEIRDAGFSGIVNFPTVALIDGQFREALEEDGNTYASEAEAIKLAHYLGLFTVAFVTDEEQTHMMLDAGADVICAHLGVTKGGFMGVNKSISLDEARNMVNKLLSICKEKRPEVIRMVYAGPANTPIEAEYLYQNTPCQGYIGGSTFDRIPAESAILQSISDFRSIDDSDPIRKVLAGQLRGGEQVDFVREYVENNYESKIMLGDLALLAHVSPSYLSTSFSQAMGCSFSEYLVRFRMKKAVEFLGEGIYSCREVAEKVGYTDYAQFSKIFKKYVGKTPRAYMKKRGINSEES